MTFQRRQEYPRHNEGVQAEVDVEEADEAGVAKQTVQTRTKIPTMLQMGVARCPMSGKNRAIFAQSHHHAPGQIIWLPPPHKKTKRFEKVTGSKRRKMCMKLVKLKSRQKYRKNKGRKFTLIIVSCWKTMDTTPPSRVKKYGGYAQKKRT